MEFISPTKGRLTFDEVFADVMEYASEKPEESYRLIVGTDSQIRDGTCFVTALIVHRKGKGGRFFYTRCYEDHVRSLRQRIFYEASLSLSVASRLAEKLSESGHELDMRSTSTWAQQRHQELGEGSGGHGEQFWVLCRIKPESYGASSVADRYTK